MHIALGKEIFIAYRTYGNLCRKGLFRRCCE
jgi:hypothetical protein